jgi:hypothetical protein
MKHLWFILLALSLAPAAVHSQALPDDPAPAAAPQAPLNSPQPPQSYDALWNRVMQIAHGQVVRVKYTSGPPVRCRFAGATDAYLFCDPPGALDGTGYRFDRFSVVDVKELGEPRNWHPGLLSAMIGGGILVGTAAARQTDAGDAVRDGIIGAIISGAVVAPFVLQPQPMFGGIGAGVTFRPHAFTHRLRLFLPLRR